MSHIIEIHLKKSHVAILSVIVLVASASAAVNIRDSMNMYGSIDMQGNSVTNATEYRFTESFVREYDANNNGQIEIGELGQAGQDFASGQLTLRKLGTIGEYFQSNIPVSGGVKAAPLTEDGKILASGAYTGTKSGTAPAGNFTFSSDINLQGNNIYNAANLDNAGSIQDVGIGLNWDQAREVVGTGGIESGDNSPASVSCETGEILTNVHCQQQVGGDLTMKSVKCDVRTSDEAKVSGNDFDRVTVAGTCVPKAGDQNGGDGNTGGGDAGSGLQTFGYQENVEGESSGSGLPGFETVLTETFDPEKDVSVISGRVNPTDGTERDEFDPRARIRISYEDGSTQTFLADDGYPGPKSLDIYASDTKRRPAVTEVNFDYQAKGRIGGDSASFRIDLISR